MMKYYYKLFTFLMCIFLLSSVTTCMTLPGLIPSDFKPSHPLSVFVSRLYSTRTLVPYDYYLLDFCKPTDLYHTYDAMGDAIIGDKIASTSYKVTTSIE